MLTWAFPVGDAVLVIGVLPLPQPVAAKKKQTKAPEKLISLSPREMAATVGPRFCPALARFRVIIFGWLRQVNFTGDSVSYDSLTGLLSEFY